MVSSMQALARSRFRSRFKLSEQDRAYIRRVGIDRLSEHAEDFIRKRLGPAYPAKDGKQTPFKGHPVFKAQHATATCCRSCLYKWHKIPAGRVLTEQEMLFVKKVIIDWVLERVVNGDL